MLATHRVKNSDNETTKFTVDGEYITYGLDVKTNRGESKSLSAFLKHKKIDEAYLAGITRGGEEETFKKIPIYTIGCRFPYN